MVRCMPTISRSSRRWRRCPGAVGSDTPGGHERLSIGPASATELARPSRWRSHRSCNTSVCSSAPASPPPTRPDGPRLPAGARLARAGVGLAGNVPQPLGTPPRPTRRTAARAAPIRTGAIMTAYIPDPELDLVLERRLPVAPDRVSAAWDPAGAAGAVVYACTVEDGVCRPRRPSRRPLHHDDESPEGEQFPNAGCYLQVEPGSLLVFTGPGGVRGRRRGRHAVHGPRRDHPHGRRRDPLPRHRHAR